MFRSAALSQKAALQLPFSSTTPPVKMGFRKVDTESAWSSCDLFFEEVNKALGNELSISWREIEPGCDIFYTHDENDFFPEECYVTANRSGVF